MNRNETINGLKKFSDQLTWFIETHIKELKKGTLDGKPMSEQVKTHLLDHLIEAKKHRTLIKSAIQLLEKENPNGK